MKNITPLKAIRLKCLDCTGFQRSEIKSCHITDCTLWRFRMGIHPFTEKNRKNPLLDASNYTQQDENRRLKDA